MNAPTDDTLDEKRVFGSREGSIPVFVASGAGVARVAVAADRVGEFSLVHREPARDVVATDGRLAIAGADALLSTGDEHIADADAVERTGFGPTTAVGFDDGLVAAGEDRVARLEDDGWTTLAEVANVRTVAGDTLAAAGGVFRLDGTHVGLDDARDVTTAGEVLAATADGLYRLGNGWLAVLDGGFRAVTADGERARAVADDGTLYAREGDGEWTDSGAPGDVVDVALAGDATYAVTGDGTFLADAGDAPASDSGAREAPPHGGWRDRSLGLPETRRLAVP